MEGDKKKEHESYGMIKVCKFSSNHSEFYGSDIAHSGGVSIEISRASTITSHGVERQFRGESLIRIDLSNSQYVDMITSSMNTEGVPCTLLFTENNKRIEQISHIEDKTEAFKASMVDTQSEYKKKIEGIIEKLTSGTVGKRKATELVHDLNVLKSHIVSNTPYVMTRFNEEMEKTVTEAKTSISQYVENKIRSTGLEHLRGDMLVSIEEPKK